MSVVAVSHAPHLNSQTTAWLTYVAERCECHRNDLVVFYFPIVRRVAGKIHRRVPGQVDLDDLISYGTLGLLKAVKLFDPYRGKPFEPVAAAHTRSVILDALRTQDWAPRSVRRRQRELDLAVESLEAALGHEPSVGEVAEFLEISEREVSLRIRETSVSKVTSLEEPVLADGSVMEVEDHSLAGSLVPREIMDVARDVLFALPIQQRAVLALHHYEGLSLVDAAAVLGLTPVRARQVHAEAVLAIRDHLAYQYA
jgi:RNA polymerase sigma factor for flagellar operon FliA